MSLDLFSNTVLPISVFIPSNDQAFKLYKLSLCVCVCERYLNSTMDIHNIDSNPASKIKCINHSGKIPVRQKQSERHWFSVFNLDLNLT